MLLKRQLLIHLNCLCSVSFPISVFFTHSLHDVLRKGQGTVSKRRGLIAYVQTTTSTANFWAQIIFDPYRRPLTLTFLLVSTRGLFQDMMFDRLHYSTLSEEKLRIFFKNRPMSPVVTLKSKPLIHHLQLKQLFIKNEFCKFRSKSIYTRQGISLSLLWIKNFNKCTSSI